MPASTYRRGRCFLLLFIAAVCYTAVIASLRAQTDFTVLFAFPTGGDTGALPAGITRGRDGNFYGTTSSGGAYNKGTVFKMTPDGQVTTLHSFSGAGPDGDEPHAELIEGEDGVFYGTTVAGGSNNPVTLGTVFKITSQGAYTPMHSFGGNPEGAHPWAPLVRATDGNFYGTTKEGGTHNFGSVYKITPDGVITTLYSFSGNDDGSAPVAALVQGGDGNLYGVTASNNNLGNSGDYVGPGSIFRISTAGAFAVLRKFVNGEAAPVLAALAVGSDGNLYGTTNASYSNAPSGTPEVFFRLDLNGNMTALYTFTPDGGYLPANQLLLGSDGNFYGTTASGGSGGGDAGGSVYRITPSGGFTELYGFRYISNDGGVPSGRLARADDGTLYGVMHIGGTNSNGTVFRLTGAGGIPTPTPGTTPTATPSPTATPATRNPYLQFVGNVTWQTNGTTATLTANQISYTNTGATSKPIRLELWAFSHPFAGIAATGYRLAIYSLPALQGGSSYNNVNSGPITFTAPPTGWWHIALLLTEQTNTSSVDDGYSFDDWVDFDQPYVNGSSAPTPTPAQLANISTRGVIRSGDSVMIGGFIVTGSAQKKVIVRGIGPSLPVAEALADPTIELHGPAGLIASNDNWQDTQASDITATGVAPTNPLEPALVATLAGNNTGYTAVLAGKNGGTGVGLVEVYDLSMSPGSALANISTRGFVDTGDNVMIGGFITTPGSGASKILVRGIGPSLSASGVASALSDPMLELHDANGAIIGSNDNWKDTQQSDIQSTGIPPSNDVESALVQTLWAGNYTVILRGKNNGTGVGLVEIYKL